MEKDLFRFIPFRKWIIDDLHLVKGIKKGGTGSLYYALNKGCPVVVKMPICQILVRGDVSGVESIAQETERLKQLQTVANVPRLLVGGKIFLSEPDMLESIPYLVIEYVDGTSLSDIIKNRIIDNEVFNLRVCSQLVDVVRCIHAKGIAHTDLNPENIIIQFNDNQTNCEKVWLLDFATHGKQRRFVAPYGSPEHYMPLFEGEIGKKSDIFSVGLICYQVWENRLPFSFEEAPAVICGQDEFKLQFIKLQDHRIQTIIKEMVRKNPEDRIDMGQIQFVME